MDLFTVGEWDALSLAAEKSWLAKQDIAARYPHLTKEEMIEEVSAEEFSDALKAKRVPKGSILIRAFNKIARVLRAFRKVSTGKGYDTPEKIFGAVLAGEIGKRQAGNTGARLAAMAQSRPRPIVVTLTGNEIPKGADIREMGQNAEQWYRENLVGKTVTHAQTGWDVQFTTVGAKKIGGRKGEDLFRLVAALPKIVIQGELVESAPDRSGRPDIKAVHKMGARVILDGKVKDVVATIRETRDGTFHYDISKDMSDGALFQSETVSAVRMSDAQVRSPALEGNPVALNLKKVPGTFKEHRPPLAVRPLTPQVRAHRNSGVAVSNADSPPAGLSNQPLSRRTNKLKEILPSCEFGASNPNVCRC